MGKEPIVNERQFRFEWDEIKAAPNLRKHGVSFELAITAFNDPRILTIADLAHSEFEERWFSIGCASNGAILSLFYLWSEVDATTSKIRLISVRKSTLSEVGQYEKTL